MKLTNIDKENCRIETIPRPGAILDDRIAIEH